MVYAFEKDTTGLVMGSFDPGSLKGEWPKIKKHIFVKEKAPWTIVPDDGAPRFEGPSEPLFIESYAKPR